MGLWRSCECLAEVPLHLSTFPHVYSRTHRTTGHGAVEESSAPLSEGGAVLGSTVGGASEASVEKEAQACGQKGWALGSDTYLGPRHFLCRTRLG